MTRSRLDVPLCAARVALAIGVTTLFACTEQPTSPSATSSSTAPSRSVGTALEPAIPLASVDWQGAARDVVVLRRLTPIVAARLYALLGVAQYGAVTAVDHDSPGAGALTTDIQRGAVAGASTQVLSYLLPGDATTFEQRLTNQGAVGSPDAMLHFADGVTVGRAIGDAIVGWGRKDGFANADGTARIWDPASLESGPGIWAMDADATPHFPAGFQYPTIQPYFLNKQKQFRPGKPPTDLTAAVNTVIAAVAARTAALADLSRSWNLNVGTMTPVGYWDVQATTFIGESGLDERAASHVFALVNAAGMDAILGCWEAKYHYLVPRPWMVRPDAFPWPSMIIGRPNHPSYPSGHSCVSAAAAEVLKSFFPTKAAMLDQQVGEAGQSRINAGIHYPMDVAAGQELGRSVAAWALKYDRNHGLLAAVGLDDRHEGHVEH
ncbi:MAG: phosphatase PAP2 family protein [Gemmatimonadaceae bacterium]